MEQLLLSILKNPSPQIIDTLEQQLNTEKGQHQFINLLTSNNIISYSYMKMKIKDWINTRYDFLLKYKNTFFNLVTDSTEYNFSLLCDTFEVMFFYFVIWDDFIDFLVALDNERSFRVLNSLFMKYRSQNKSDRLYSEIIVNISKVAPLFVKYYNFRWSGQSDFISGSNTVKENEINNVSKFYNNQSNADISNNNVINSSNCSTNFTKPLPDKNLLNILYSLIYQDIHPFFESNISTLTNTLTTLYKLTNFQPLINDIYLLITTKYFDLVDLTKIFGSILISLTNFDQVKYSVLNNIIRKNSKTVFQFEDVLINAIKIGSILSEKEKDEMMSVEYSRNIICNVDVYRGIITDIVGNIKRVNENFVGKLINCISRDGEIINMNINKCENESMGSTIEMSSNINSITTTTLEEWQIFLFTALKLKTSNLIKKCKLAINNSNEDKFISFASFRYLLSIKEYSTFDYRIINREHPACYLSMFMLINYIQEQSPLEKKILNEMEIDICKINGDGSSCNVNIDSNRIIDNNSTINNVSNRILDNIFCNILDNLSNFITSDIEDEYSTLLINRIVKDNPRIITDSFYSQLISLCIENILNINSLTAYSYIFDTISILFLDRARNKESNKIKNDIMRIVNLVVSEEIVELYSSAFYMLSVLIMSENACYSGDIVGGVCISNNNRTNYSNMVNIVSQTALWSTKELYLSLICLTISLYKSGYMTEIQVDYIVQYLCNINLYYAHVLSDSTTRSVQVIEDIEELFIYKSGDILYKEKIGDNVCKDSTNNISSKDSINNSFYKNKEEYIKIYKNALEYFNTNYITKKNARRVTRAFLRGSKFVNDEMYKNIIDKNLFNLGYDNVPYSVYMCFDI